MLPTWRNFWQTRLQKHPKMKEKSETGIEFQKQLPNRFKPKGFGEHLPISYCLTPPPPPLWTFEVLPSFIPLHFSVLTSVVLFCNCPLFVIALVPSLFFGGNTDEPCCHSVVVSTKTHAVSLLCRTKCYNLNRNRDY